MAKILRKAAKIFGSTAGGTQIGEFGSFALGTPTFSADPDVIQSGAFSTWLQGWFSAILGANSPAIEDMNAVCFVLSYQIAYGLQQGVPEWNSTTTYYIGSIVNFNGLLFYSLTDNNLNNPLADVTNWALVGNPGLNPQANGLLGNRAVNTWTETNTSQTNSWNSICWSPELLLFVAVASSGVNRVSTSPDGKTWTNQTASAANPWTSVAWSPELGLFAAVAGLGANRVMTSPDGVTWTGHADTGSGATWESICWSWELGLFVAVGQGGTTSVMTSPDGVTWTARVAASVSLWQGICWSPERNLFVAVALDGAVMTSFDSITWTSQTPVSFQQWFSVTWSPQLGLFAMVSNDGFIEVSRDGVTWIGAAAPGAAFTGIAWSPELGEFVTIATSTANRVYTSRDGLIWVARTASSAQTWIAIAWADELGIFSAISGGGGGGTKVMVSKYVKKFIY